jgi:hypothetical protein
MKKLILSMLAMGLLFFVGCDGTEHRASDNAIIRTADPCNAYDRPGWKSGPDAVITPELQGGNASHLWPAEIIYYSVLENTLPSQGILINPVLVLVYLENADLLSFGQEYGDFEMRLLKAVGYDATSNKYNGFYPQLVSSTYQWRVYQKRGLSFAEAQKGYPFASSSGISFSDAYAKYAKTMNDILGTTFSLYPDSRGYYQDFAGLVDANKIQLFLARIGSSLQGNLFNQPPVQTTVFDYSNPAPFCE